MNAERTTEEILAIVLKTIKGMPEHFDPESIKIREGKMVIVNVDKKKQK